MKNRFDIFGLILIFASGLILLFIIAPLTGMYLQTTLPELKEAFMDSSVRDSIWLTLWTAFLSTLILAIAAIPFSYLLARKKFPFKRLATAIVDIPVVIPHVAAGIALLGVVSRHTTVGQVAERMGLSFVGTPLGIMLAMAFVSLPFLINAARDGFESVPIRLEKAAMNLGATPLRVFFTISLPLAWRPILSGLILMSARGMSEFGAVVIIAYHPMIAPIKIYDRFASFGLQYSRSVAVLFITVCLLIFLVLKLLSWRRLRVER